MNLDTLKQSLTAIADDVEETAPIANQRIAAVDQKLREARRNKTFGAVAAVAAVAVVVIAVAPNVSDSESPKPSLPTTSEPDRQQHAVAKVPMVEDHGVTMPTMYRTGSLLAHEISTPGQPSMTLSFTPLTDRIFYGVYCDGPDNGESATKPNPTIVVEGGDTTVERTCYRSGPKVEAFASIGGLEPGVPTSVTVSEGTGMRVGEINAFGLAIYDDAQRTSSIGGVDVPLYDQFDDRLYKLVGSATSRDGGDTVRLDAPPKPRDAIAVLGWSRNNADRLTITFRWENLRRSRVSLTGTSGESIIGIPRQEMGRSVETSGWGGQDARIYVAVYQPIPPTTQ